MLQACMLADLALVLKKVEEQIVQATEALEATEEWQRLEALRREYAEGLQQVAALVGRMKECAA